MEGIKSSQLNFVGTYYPPLKFLIDKLLITSTLIEKKTLHRKMTRQRIDNRLQQSSDRTDFLVKMVEPDSGVSYEELLANASLLTNAGSETTSTLLATATYLLLKNTEKREIFQQELDRALKSPDQITCEATSSLPYIQACLDEALRLLPPLPSSLPRRTPAGGDFINGNWVPEDVSPFLLLLIGNKPLT